jgi:hypothetical protein
MDTEKVKRIDGFRLITLPEGLKYSDWESGSRPEGV